MDAHDANALLWLGTQRSRNFSEAADAILGTLDQALPGAVVLTRRETDEHVQRVVDVRGGAVERLTPGAVLRLAGDGIDPDALRELGARTWISSPLEISNGQIAGVLCAADPDGGVYSPRHKALLSIAARLLGYEWERVELRSELRRLRARLNAGPGFDAETGLPNRDSFLDLVGHEWRLAQRGTVQSVLVAFHIHGTGENGDEATPAKQVLALKIAAEVLEGSTRETDRVGRIAPETIGVVLIGCRTSDTPSFIARFLSALERVSDGNRIAVGASCGIQPLNESSSPEEAVGLAEAAALADRGGQPSAQGAVVE